MLLKCIALDEVIELICLLSLISGFFHRRNNSKHKIGKEILETKPPPEGSIL